MQVADQPPVIDLPHDELDRVEGSGLTRLVEHRQEDARQQLHHQHDHGDEAKEVPDVEVLGRVVTGGLSFDELLDRQALVEPGLQAFARCFFLRPARIRGFNGYHHPAAPNIVVPQNKTAALRAWTHVSVAQGGGALYTQQSPAFGHVCGTLYFTNHEAGMSRIGRVIMFVAASVVSGLALAFIIVAWRPQLVEMAPVPAPPAADSGKPDHAPIAVENSGASRQGTAGESGAALTADGQAPVILFPGRDAWSYADAVQRAGPAVVNIYTSRTVTERVQPFGAIFGDPAPRYRNRTERSLGSGVIVDTEGHIATNNHVIENADQVWVQLADRRVAVAKVVGRDPDSDLALLKIGLNHLPVMPFGHSDKLQVGDVVLAIGNPLGLSQTVTHGIVSATARGELGLATFENFIQTDAAINPGNSGGALINTRGELVGINTAIVDKTSGAEGIGFAIPVNMVRGVIHDLITRGKVVRGWIGIIPEDFSDEQAASVGLTRGGVVVVDLDPGPAWDAGLRRGDILTSFDGRTVTSSQDMLAHIASTQPGATIRLAGVRGRATFQASITVRQRPRDL